MRPSRREERRARIKKITARQAALAEKKKSSRFRHAMAVMVLSGLGLFGLACFIVCVKGWPK